MAKQGKLYEAIGHFSRAVQINPNFAKAHKNLSQAYWLLGNKSVALREYEIVKGLDSELANKLLNWMHGSTPNG
ncbi:MAG: tetratricopeptide repeat protein [Pseudomonadota bacterium]